MCAVHNLIAKKYSIRMFTKFKFTLARQITALLLEKQKSWKNGAKCALCSAKFALSQKIEYKNVYEI